jgi:predicted nucleic acid-binding protein
MIAYLDTSAVLRWLVFQDETLAGITGTLTSSELLLIEGSRVLHRMRLARELDDERLAAARTRFLRFGETITIIPLETAVKRRAAAAFPTGIGTLDAIHLASALLWAEHANETVAIFSYDRQMNTCALALGLAAPLAG